MRDFRNRAARCCRQSKRCSLLLTPLASLRANMTCPTAGEANCFGSGSSLDSTAVIIPAEPGFHHGRIAGTLWHSSGHHLRHRSVQVWGALKMQPFSLCETSLQPLPTKRRVSHLVLYIKTAGEARTPSHPPRTPPTDKAKISRGRRGIPSSAPLVFAHPPSHPRRQARPSHTLYTENLGLARGCASIALVLMASDQDYMAFLDKANQDPYAGRARTQGGPRASLKTTDEGRDVPNVIRDVCKSEVYVSEADEPFHPVALTWAGDDGLPDEGRIRVAPTTRHLILGGGPPAVSF